MFTTIRWNWNRKSRMAVLGLLVAVATVAVAASAGAAVEVGKAAPDFTLTDTEGQEHALSAYLEQGKIVVLEWFNPDCPFIKKHHARYTTMNDLFAAYQEKDVVWLAINSGAPGKQGHGLDRNRKARKEFKMEYPVLIDEKGEVGRLFGAKTTPHMFVIDTEGTVIYNGAIDDDRSPGKLGKTNYVKAALAGLLGGKKIETPRTDPYGCSVKYASR